MPLILGTNSIKDTGYNVANSLRFNDDSSDRIEVYNYFGGGFDSKLVTNRVFRDVSAWYHIVIVYDSGNSTEAFRLRIYVNGTEESSFSTTNYPSLNADSDLNVSGSNIEIGRQANVVSILMVTWQKLF